MLKSYSLFSAVIVAAFLLGSCDFDQGIGLLKSKISGKVIYVGDPDTTVAIDEVRVVVAAKFPPQGFGDIFFSDAIQFEVDATEYEVPLTLGHYPAVALLWKARDRDWELTNLLGFYGFNLESFEAQLLPVDLTEEQPINDQVDIRAYWGLTNFDARAEGHIDFAGAWPEDTEIVILGAFTKLPNVDNLLLSLGFLGGLDVAVPTFVDQHDFRFSLRNGDYEFIGMFWKGASIKWEELKLIGFYPSREDPSVPGKFSVSKQGSISGLDFTADFNTLPEGIKLMGTPN